jgi:hypothetical protein
MNHNHPLIAAAFGDILLSTNGQWRTAASSSRPAHRELSGNEITSSVSRTTARDPGRVKGSTWKTRNRYHSDQTVGLLNRELLPLPRKPAHFACEHPRTNSMISNNEPHLSPPIAPFRTNRTPCISRQRAHPGNRQISDNPHLPADPGSSGQQGLSLKAAPFCWERSTLHQATSVIAPGLSARHGGRRATSETHDSGWHRDRGF